MNLSLSKETQEIVAVHHYVREIPILGTIHKHIATFTDYQAVTKALDATRSTSRLIWDYACALSELGETVR